MAVGAWGWQPHHLHVPNVMEIWEPKPPGTLWVTPGLLRDSFTFSNIWYGIESVKFSSSFYRHFCSFLFFCLSVLMKEMWCHTYGEVGLLCWRLVQAVNRFKREVMNSTTVEQLFLSDNQLPVCSYLFVKQQAKQEKSGWETNKQTNYPTKPTHIKEPVTWNSQLLTEGPRKLFYECALIIKNTDFWDVTQCCLV